MIAPAVLFLYAFYLDGCALNTSITPYLAF
nr:MAG TPA: hypothetical protein [Caudoviricetes sp.]DAV62994.1 MAG TPA: hypothetical protein [Caudoviricetes sp.]